MDILEHKNKEAVVESGFQLSDTKYSGFVYVLSKFI